MQTQKERETRAGRSGGRYGRLPRRLFGDQLVGVYLYGSAMLGGFCKEQRCRPLIILGEPLSGAEKAALTDQLLRLSGCPATGGAGGR